MNCLCQNQFSLCWCFFFFLFGFPVIREVNFNPALKKEKRKKESYYKSVEKPPSFVNQTGGTSLPFRNLRRRLMCVSHPPRRTRVVSLGRRFLAWKVLFCLFAAHPVHSNSENWSRKCPFTRLWKKQTL